LPIVDCRLPIARCTEYPIGNQKSAIGNFLDLRVCLRIWL